MENLLAGLKLHEILLMFLGVILFLALVFILIWKVMKGTSIKSLAIFFLLPIVMIGYTSIKSIAWGDLKIDVNETARAVNNNPNDTTAANKLALLLQQMDLDRIKGDPQALLGVANAESALGNYDTALSIVNQSIESGGANAEAEKTKADIETKMRVKHAFEKQLDAINVIMKDNAVSEAQKTEKVAGILSTIEPPVYISKQSSLTLAKAFSVVNEKEKAIETVTKITEASPSNNEARILANTLKEDTTSQQPVREITPELKMELKRSPVLTAPQNKLVIKKTYQKQTR